MIAKFLQGIYKMGHGTILFLHDPFPSGVKRVLAFSPLNIILF